MRADIISAAIFSTLANSHVIYVIPQPADVLVAVTVPIATATSVPRLSTATLTTTSTLVGGIRRYELKRRQGPGAAPIGNNVLNPNAPTVAQAFPPVSALVVPAPVPPAPVVPAIVPPAMIPPAANPAAVLPGPVVPVPGIPAPIPATITPPTSITPAVLPPAVTSGPNSIELVTIQWVETWLDKTSRTWVPKTYTIKYDHAQTPPPAPGEGVIGMGTLTGNLGVTKTVVIGAAETVGVNWVQGAGVAAVVGLGLVI